MDRRMILYRGSLKSCNYRCSYCPFSKHPVSERELSKDRERWEAFVNGYEEKAEALGLGALMVVPYGEAMIHPWYREGLARLSARKETDAVGAQTNLSFSVPEFLGDYQRAGGVAGKLRFWATFHPQMTEAVRFAGKCRELMEAGARLCAGCVGVPENIEVIRELRDLLPEDIYLWINKMDGLHREYTPYEREAFLAVDSYFGLELTPVSADPQQCRGRLFVEGDGKVRACNISQVQGIGWEELGTVSEEAAEVDIPSPACSRKQCSCYLAYAGRNDFAEKGAFGQYPLFRIPETYSRDNSGIPETPQKLLAN